MEIKSINTVEENINYYSYYGKQYGDSSEK
jgi:hypothetical protein